MILEKVVKNIFHFFELNISTIFSAKFVSVGWGSKETQFHGSEGKGARNKKEIQSSLLDWDDKRTRIVWRADGLFFAVCAVDPSFGNSRMKLLSVTLLLDVFFKNHF